MVSTSERECTRTIYVSSFSSQNFPHFILAAGTSGIFIILEGIDNHCSRACDLFPFAAPLFRFSQSARKDFQRDFTRTRNECRKERKKKGGSLSKSSGRIDSTYSSLMFTGSEGVAINCYLIKRNVSYFARLVSVQFYFRIVSFWLLMSDKRLCSLWYREESRSDKAEKLGFTRVS